MKGSDIKLMQTLGSKIISEEWIYFQEWARRFDENEPAERYGMLPFGAPCDLDQMIFAPDPLSLRRKDLQYIANNPRGGTVGFQVRKHLDWLEKLEGKQ